MISLISLGTSSSVAGHYICGESIVKKGRIIIFNVFGLSACSISALGLYRRGFFSWEAGSKLDITYGACTDCMVSGHVYFVSILWNGILWLWGHFTFRNLEIVFDPTCTNIWWALVHRFLSV